MKLNIVSVEDNEDNEDYVDLSVDMDEEAEAKVINIGLELLLTSIACGISVEEALDHIRSSFQPLTPDELRDSLSASKEEVSA